MTKKKKALLEGLHKIAKGIAEGMGNASNKGSKRAKAPCGSCGGKK